MTDTEVWHHPDPDGSHGTDIVRHNWLLAFLQDHGSEFDRVFMMDAFDIFFHRDPFEVLTATDTMVFFEEGWSLMGAGLNPSWLQNCYGTLADPILVNQTLCCGTLYGGTAVFIQFLRTLLELWPPREKCPWDQAVLNFLMYTNEFAKHWIKATTVQGQIRPAPREMRMSPSKRESAWRARIIAGKPRSSGLAQNASTSSHLPRSAKPPRARRLREAHPPRRRERLPQLLVQRAQRAQCVLVEAQRVREAADLDLDLDLDRALRCAAPRRRGPRRSRAPRGMRAGCSSGTRPRPSPLSRPRTPPRGGAD
jgi:hypothetical protein